MKKILSILGVVGLMSTASMAVVTVQTEQQVKPQLEQVSNFRITDIALKGLAFLWNRKDIQIEFQFEGQITSQKLKDFLIKYLNEELIARFKMNKEWEFSNDVITKITIGNEIIWEHQQLEEKDLTELLQETQTVGITIRNTEFRFKITVKTDLN